MNSYEGSAANNQSLHSAAEQHCVHCALSISNAEFITHLTLLVAKNDVSIAWRGESDQIIGRNGRLAKTDPASLPNRSRTR